jgi:hypothetical protein
MEKKQQAPWYYDTKTVNDNESNIKNQISSYIVSQNSSIEDGLLNDIISNVYSGREFKTPSPVLRPLVCPSAPKKVRRTLKL